MILGDLAYDVFWAVVIASFVFLSGWMIQPNF